MLRNLLKRCQTVNNYRNLASATSVSDGAQFPGYKGEFTTNLEFLFPETKDLIPCYRVTNRRGQIIDPAHDPKLDKPTLVKMYQNMILLNQLDIIMYEAQRQGRITFYLTNHGESAVQLGSAAALNPKDLIYAQYRESGVLIWRGFTMDQCCNQIFGNALGTCKGRQMPIHYGSKELNFVTISSPIATQLPQAAGSAYAFKRAQNGLCCVAYFGDGASSEGDAHAAMNFAAVYEVPLIFICRNNGYAISTPVRDQYRGDGIASRGAGYGIVTIRVDGNDLFAVYNATKAAREIAVTQSRPVLIEAMTYRLGHHSTSDDSTAYRSIDEINSWEKDDNPILRFKNYLIQQNLWSIDQDQKFIKEARSLVFTAFEKAEKVKKSKITDMFEDVYDQVPINLEKQKTDLLNHLKIHKDKYPMDTFERI